MQCAAVRTCLATVRSRPYCVAAAEAAKKGDFPSAETLYRAQLVQYLKWVHEHTIPFLSTNSAVINELEAIDVNALPDLADVISHCMAPNGKASEIVAFLNHVQSVVPLTSFWERTTVLCATCLLIALDDQDGARRELSKL